MDGTGGRRGAKLQHYVMLLWCFGWRWPSLCCQQLLAGWIKLFVLFSAATIRLASAIQLYARVTDCLLPGHLAACLSWELFMVCICCKHVNVSAVPVSVHGCAVLVCNLYQSNPLWCVLNAPLH